MSENEEIINKLRNKSISLLREYKEIYNEEYIIVRKKILDDFFGHVVALQNKLKWAGIEIV